MKILFIHQNMPGQFKYLAPFLARSGKDEVVFLTKRPGVRISGVRKIQYTNPQPPIAGVHPYLYRMENAVRHGQQVARCLLRLRRTGFVPDLIIAHPGWGESLFCKDVFPNVPLINLCEFFYHGSQADVGFDPESPSDIDTICRARTRAGHLLLSLESCDIGVSPTRWQKSVHPNAYQDKIRIIPDGIDTGLVKPNPRAELTLPTGTKLTKNSRVVTYVARNLEPYRGYRTFIRALPEIQRLQPDAEILVIGGDDVSYGAPPNDPEFPTWRAAMDAEVDYDHSRVHFLGRLPYAQYLRALQISSAHIYLTYPFVLSWSCLEAMACEAFVIGSATAPVEEIIEDRKNGVLVDFFDPQVVARRVHEALERPQMFQAVRAGARKTIVDGYEIRKSLGKWRALLGEITN